MINSCSFFAFLVGKVLTLRIPPGSQCMEVTGLALLFLPNKYIPLGRVTPEYCRTVCSAKVRCARTKNIQDAFKHLALKSAKVQVKSPQQDTNSTHTK